MKNAQATSTSVVLKEKVQVKVGRDEYVTSHISDHFGVSATVE